MEKGKQELSDPVLWDRDWDTKKTEATEEDIKYVKGFQPQPKNVMESSGVMEGASTVVS